LGLEFFETAVALQKRYASGKQVENAFQTNGVLLDDRWGAFLARNAFLVGISTDGPEELHDVYRTFKGGQPSFKALLRALRLLKSTALPSTRSAVCTRKTKTSRLPSTTF